MTQLVQSTIPPPSAPPEPAHRLARYAWAALLSIGILAVAVGSALLVVPEGLVPALLGGYLILSGIGQLPVPFGSHLGNSRVLALLAADGYVIFGTLCLNEAFMAPALIALWTALAMIVRGLTWQNATLMNKAMPSHGLQGLAGLVVLLCGNLLLAVRPDAPAALAMLAGPVLMLVGALEIITAIGVRRSGAGADPDPQEKTR
ncbi:hypothetical protein [[Mycobacterium] vasticus]|uniref:HdeD family acid-resistance protein n=1 Tax=[Mycobacterium] vasticus TaxID=2875777 RepID=A0ABU5Z0T7_9MYCO|nr:hypothetical protein [Mycolicibacter sp. MYC017]MEB3070998.1 hypothetical protein [Mycolicibacter sp. MYC017]